VSSHPHRDRLPGGALVLWTIPTMSTLDIRISGGLRALYCGLNLGK